MREETLFWNMCLCLIFGIISAIAFTIGMCMIFKSITDKIGIGLSMALISVFLIVVYSLVLYVDIYEEVNLVKGNTRKIYRANKKLMKLKAKKHLLEKKKEYMRQKREWNKEEVEIKREICCLTQELKTGYIAICEGCGKKIPPYACFCPHCGIIIHKEEM